MSEDLKRKAYSEALKLKNEGLEEEVIYARLEKKGYPHELAIEVAANVYIQRRVEKQQDDTKKIEENNYKLALIVGGSVVFAIVSWLFLPKVVIILPVGIAIGVLINFYKSK